MINFNSQYFFILSRGRTGSHWLSTSLDSHLHIKCFREAFNETPRPVKGRFKDIDEDGEEFFKYIKKSNIGVPVVGVQLIYNQEEIKSNQTLWQAIEEDKNIKIIHSLRKNLFKSYVSMTIANITRVFHTEDRYNPILPPFYIDPESCRVWMKDSLSSIQNVRTRFSNHSSLIIYYESLVNNFVGESKKIQHFLGVDYQVLKSKVKKLKYLKNQVLNYEELKDYFSKTNFSWMFHD